MALGDPYVTSTELKSRLEIEGTELDARLTAAVLAASEDIETYCNRQFNKVASPVQRKYRAVSDVDVFVDDFHTTTGLAVSIVERERGSSTTTALTASDFEERPDNSDREGCLGFPYWQLKNYSLTDFPDREDGYVLVTAAWGWAAVPDAIVESCYILAEEYFKMKDAPFGVQNWGEFGPMRVGENRVVKRLLDRYARGKVLLES